MSSNSSSSSDTSRSHSPVPTVTSASTVPSVENIKPPEEITDADRKAAASLKAEANKAFQSAFQFHSSASAGLLEANEFCIAGGYLKAAELYTEASIRNPYDATLFCNSESFGSPNA